MNWNYHMGNHFESCRLIATGYDPYCKAEVRYFMLPGNFECVGVSDGCHSHVVPLTSIAPSINRLQGLVDEIQQGGNPAVKDYNKSGGQKRHAVDLDVEEFKPRKIKRHQLDDAALA